MAELPASADSMPSTCNVIEYIQRLVRKAPVMHGIVNDLACAEIDVVATYVQSL